MRLSQCLRAAERAGIAGDALRSLRGVKNELYAPSITEEDCLMPSNQNTIHHQTQVTPPPSLDLQSNLKSILNELNQFRRNTTSLNELSKLRQLSLLLLSEPQAASEVWKVGAVPRIAELSRCGREKVEQQARVALSLLGHPPQYCGRGLRILAVDGGGTRGIIPLIMLRQLERLCGMETHKMFDYVCGTSTGAVLAALLFVRRASIDEAEEMYRQFSIQVFKMNNLLGIGQLFLNHAFYDTKLLEKVIRSCASQGDRCLYETPMDPLTVPFSVISTVINQPVVQPFLFTNYRHQPSRRSQAHYQSDCSCRLWEALMASTAAPGYFEEMKLGPHILQDGALLTNNPTAIALHEARLLWGRQTPIQTVISLGTGIYSKPLPTDVTAAKSISLKEKLTKIVLSATDTEAVHTILRDLLPSSTYFRFNPHLSEDIMMDESKPEKLELLVSDAESYMAANERKMEEAAACLMQGKLVHQKAWQWAERGWNSVRSRAGVMAAR